MDARRFDQFVIALSLTGTRRGLLSRGAGLPLAGLLAARLEAEEAAAKRKKRKKKKKKNKNKQKPCVAESPAQTCAGKCATVTNNCQQAVDCGPCSCSPPCPVCQSCNASTGQCVPDTARDGQACGAPGEVCAQGACVQTCGGVLPTADLQAAIDAANPGSILDLCPGTWKLTSAVSIGKDLTLRGAGVDQTILDGGDENRVLKIAAGVTVTVQDLTITRGRASGAAPANNGGGIFNEGSLSLLGAAVTGNFAKSGGGIFNSGTLTLQTGSNVSDNVTTGDGGGINNGSMLTLQAGSRVTGNITTGNGGGIINGGTLTLETSSEVSGNTAGDNGGGIFNSGFTVVLKPGSRVSGNSADAGGGIFNIPLGMVTLEDGALVCDNEPLADQCSGPGTITGVCPNPADVCPA